MKWREFQTLGTEIIITASLKADREYILEEAESIIRDFEQRFSRFIPGNELWRLNNQTGEQREVSDMMYDLLFEAKSYYLKTHGVFDPTIIGSLEAVGYDKSFDLISTGRDQRKPKKIDLQKVAASFHSRPKMDNLEFNGRSVDFPTGFRVDFGGLGKGYIVDLISQKLFKNSENYWISAGGDILVSGHDDGQAAWEIGVQNPHEPENNILSINTGGRKLGVATSGIIKRHGEKGDFKWHHLIDPRSGLPVINDILSVTAISTSALKADILAKTVLILGRAASLKFVEQEGDSAVLIFLKDTQVIFSKRARDFIKNYDEAKRST